MLKVINLNGYKSRLVWTADWIAEPVVDPVEYNEQSVNDLIDDLMLHYKIEVC